MGMEEWQKLKPERSRSNYHISWREVDVGGRGRYSNMYVLNLKVSFLPVKMSSFDHVKVWSPKLW